MFPRGIAERYDEALAVARSLSDECRRAYYVGIVYERRAKAHYRSATPGCGPLAYDWLQKAMDKFAEAEKLRSEGNKEAALRWNNCVRRLRAHPDLRPDDDDEDIAPQLGK